MADPRAAEFHPLDNRSRWCIGLNYALILAEFLVLPALLTSPDTGALYLPGLEIPLPPMMETLALVSIFLYGALLIAATIVFLAWTYRAAGNAVSLSTEDPNISPGWAVGWYFVPLFFLWKPYQALGRIWRTSLSPGQPHAAALPASFRLFWTFGVISSVLGQLSFRLGTQATQSVDRPSPEMVVDLILLPIDVIVALVTISVVRHVTQAQTGAVSESVFA